MSDEESAARAENTSHLGRGLPQYNHPLSLPHTELAGKAIHRRHTQEETQVGGVEERKGHLQCCSKEFNVYLELMVIITHIVLD